MVVRCFFWKRANSVLEKFVIKKPPILLAPRAKVKFKANLNKLLENYYPQVDLHLAFRNKLNIGSFFRSKDEIPKMLRSRVVYKYTCKICKDFYIGKTVRTLRTRVFQHMGLSERTSAPLVKKDFSSIRLHMEEHGDEVDPDQFEILDYGGGEVDLLILETLWSNEQSPKISRKGSSLILCSVDVN